MSVIKKLRQVLEQRHDYARKWKEQKRRKAIGYMCIWAPEEMIYAAGALPVRIVGSHEPQDVTEPHLYSMFCSYCRDCLAQGLQGRYDYLDGIVYAQGCYHIRQAYDSWVRHVKPGFARYFYTPTNIARRGTEAQIVRELEVFQEALGKTLGLEVTRQQLQEAVDVYNTNRQLMRQIYEMRKADIPPISGSEAMVVVLASQLMDKREHNDLLVELLQELGQRSGRARPEPRVMLIGSELDDPGLCRLVEELGGDVVIDDNCVGSRYFWNDVLPNGDLFQAIADRYILRPPCPVYDYAGGQSRGLPTMGGGERRRLPYIKALAEDYRVQGAILALNKFCDPHEYDAPAIQKMLREMGIPTLKLELDITLPVGQFRTRIEAFFETMAIEV